MLTANTIDFQRHVTIGSESLTCATSVMRERSPSSTGCSKDLVQSPPITTGPTGGQVMLQPQVHIKLSCTGYPDAKLIKN